MSQEENMNAKFDAYYENDIVPELQKVEEIRLKYLDIFKKVKVIGISITLIAIIGMFFADMGWSSLSPIILLLIALAIPQSLYANKVKKSKATKAIFRFFGDFEYSNYEEISERFLKESKIIPKYDDKYVDDHIEGTYKDVKVTVEEANLTKKVKKTDSDGNTRYKHKEVFDGLFLIFSMNKKFEGQTIVRADLGALNFAGNLVMGSLNGLQNIKLEDPTFERYFEVYGSDQTESRYLLTTAFMERLIKLKEKFNTVVQTSFFDEKIFLTINSKYKNWFEFSNLHKTALDKERIKNVIREVNMLLSIIDTLKLDMKIGL